MWKKVDLPAADKEVRCSMIRGLFNGVRGGRNGEKLKLFSLHAGKPTATMTSVLLEVREADGGSYSLAVESSFL